MQFGYINNLSTRLTAALSGNVNSVILEIEEGAAAIEETLLTNNNVALTLFSKDRLGLDVKREVVHAVSVSGGQITVKRAQEGTEALQFFAGEYVEARLTKEALGPFYDIGSFTNTLIITNENVPEDNYSSKDSIIIGNGNDVEHDSFYDNGRNVVIGRDQLLKASSTVAIGRENLANENTVFSAVIGKGNEVVGSRQAGIAIGYENTANGSSSGLNSVAIGQQNSAGGNQSIAIGVGCEATGYDPQNSGAFAVAIGRLARATQPTSLAVGNGADATGEQSVSVGTATTASAQYAVAGGYRADATATGATALGYEAIASGANSIAAGTNASAAGNNAIAAGRDSNASGVSAIAMGLQSTSSEEVSIALGFNAAASAVNAIAVGRSTQSSAEDAASIGNGANAQAARSIAIGTNAEASPYTGFTSADGAVAAGAYSYAGADRAAALGDGSYAIGLDSCAVGSGSSAIAEASIAVGLDSSAEGGESIAIGKNAMAKGERNLSLGFASAAFGRGAIAVGPAVGYSLGSMSLGSFSAARIRGGVSVSGIPYSSRSAFAFPPGFDTSMLPPGTTAKDLIEQQYGEAAPSYANHFASQVSCDTEVIDLSDSASYFELELPPRAMLFPEHIDVVIMDADAPGGSPAIKLGAVGGTDDDLLAASNITKTSVGGRQRFAPSSMDGITSFSVSVDAVATGTLTAKVVISGYVLEMSELTESELAADSAP